MQPLQLAIDTSTSRPVAALLSGERLLREWMGPDALRHHETLLAGIDECLRGAGHRLDELGYLSVGVGPGLFTGLRIGLTTAKFLADPLGIPCVPVSSLMALGWQSELLGSAAVWAVSDAKSRRVYALRLAPEAIPADFSAPLGEEVAVSPEEAAASMHAGDFLIGEGAVLYASLWPQGVRLATEGNHGLRGGAIGFLGARRYALGLTCSANDLQPTYLKTSQAIL